VVPIIVILIALMVIWRYHRDLSTPSSRLVGHWTCDWEIQEEVRAAIFGWAKEAGPYLSHHYYGPIGLSGLGNHSWVSRKGEVFHMYYEVISEIPDGEEVTICTRPTFFGKRNDAKTFRIDKNGQHMENTAGGPLSFFYEDSRRKP
jgi:hypothetical protein